MTKKRETEGEAIEVEFQDFATFINDLDYGNVNARLGEQLSKLVAAVNEVGKQGTLTLKIIVKKDSSCALVSAECTTKIPEHPLNGSMFFFGEDGNSLHREDPRQLKLKNLDKPALRTVDFPTGGKDGSN
jgi:hypothetical protein